METNWIVSACKWLPLSVERNCRNTNFTGHFRSHIYRSDTIYFMENVDILIHHYIWWTDILDNWYFYITLPRAQNIFTSLYWCIEYFNITLPDAQSISASLHLMHCIFRRRIVQGALNIPTSLYTVHWIFQYIFLQCNEYCHVTSYNWCNISILF